MNDAKQHAPPLDKNDGGPAFPAIYGAEEPLTEGMTLRDYFAAAALKGLITAGNGGPNGEAVSDGSWTFPDVRAKVAYIYADAMLKERSK
jgi:hypothetical protein